MTLTTKSIEQFRWKPLQKCSTEKRGSVQLKTSRLLRAVSEEGEDPASKHFLGKSRVVCVNSSSEREIFAEYSRFHYQHRRSLSRSRLVSVSRTIVRLLVSHREPAKVKVLVSTVDPRSSLNTRRTVKFSGHVEWNARRCGSISQTQLKLSSFVCSRSSM